MERKKMTRREAVHNLAKFTAMAAGLSSTEVSRLIGQVQRQTSSGLTIDTAKLLKINPQTPEGKFYKFLVIPTRDVFVSEFGREPQIVWGDFSGLACLDLASAGQSTTSSHDCDGTNNCGEQKCSELLYCTGTNNCGDQSCPNLKWPGNKNMLSPGTVELVRNDPFVQALFQEFHAKTSQDLSRELMAMVRQRRGK